MVGLKLHINDFSNNLEKEMKSIKAQEGFDDAKNAKHFSDEFVVVESEINRLQEAVPKIELLEKDLELTDTGKDEELEEYAPKLRKVMSE